MLLLEVVEEFGVGEVALASIEVAGEAAADGFDLVFDADGGGKAGEEDAARFDEAEEVFEHALEFFVVAGEMEDGVADDEVEGGVFEGHRADGFDAEVLFGQVRGELAEFVDGVGIDVDRGDVEALGEEEADVAATAAAGIEDAHAGGDAAAHQHVEEIDVGAFKLA